jgi:epoxyqueuosine reductase
MPPITQIAEAIKRAALAEGFDLAGIAPVHDAPELEHFPRWIAAGHAGEMKYLESRTGQGDLKRSSLRHVAPWARSVIVCAINYNTSQPYSTQVADPARGWISRYAWSREDYHDAVLKKLRAIESKLLAIVKQSTEYQVPSTEYRVPSPENHAALATSNSVLATHDSVLTTRSYVDTGPLVERVYAKYAGVGWIGKNTCILNQQKGSWMFLGVILTSLDLQPDFPAPDRCGTCTRCLDACPTQAFIAPYQLDSTRCISYLTIEKRGAIPEDLMAGMGRHIFGCDICQDVCPWNRKAPATTAPEFQPRPELVNPALDWLAEISPEEFREVFRGSPIKRAKRTGLRRNAAIAMGNSGDQKFLPLLNTLASDEDATVAESARWAKKKLAP